MNIQIALSVAIIVLLAVNIFIVSRNGQRNTGGINALLKRNADELYEVVRKQISDGATEQFKRFEIIQKGIRETMSLNGRNIESVIHDRFASIQRNNIESIEKINLTLEMKIKEIRESNESRLDRIQGIVDNKLQKTLDERLSKSFEIVGRQLESVQRGLGEMKNLAADAKSIKNALTNVKERGIYGEVRLEKLLTDILVPGQYEINAEIENGKRVEFAVKLPGNGDKPLLLPIDSKFPVEDYNRLIAAEEKADTEEARKGFVLRIRACAKEIFEKYILPPKTTDFALMFLPTEGIFAEVVRDPGLFEDLRDRFKVTPVGPTTLSAFLASLQMGFKTLAIEERSQEVWDTLREVKKAFEDFERLLETAHKQLLTADNTLEKLVGIRTRAINKALRDVQEPAVSENNDI